MVRMSYRNPADPDTTFAEDEADQPARRPVQKKRPATKHRPLESRTANRPPPLTLRRGRLRLLDIVSPRERLLRLHEVLHLPFQLELLRRWRRRWWRLVRR